MKYLKYLWYVIRHKWFVFGECCKYDMIWRGVVHDISKLLPSEFFPYANYFYGDYPSIKEVHGDMRNRMHPKYKEEVEKEFDFAWLLHQKRNKHHWQWWLLPEDDGGFKVLEMANKFRKEMVSDWKGAGRAQGHGDDIVEWYMANRSNMQLHAETRQIIERYVIGLESLLATDIGKAL